VLVGREPRTVALNSLETLLDPDLSDNGLGLKPEP
jgi:hypothetical protein